MDMAVAVRPPQDSPLGTEILTGLHAPQKTLPAKLFYDARGSQLFDRICNLPEYYLTRTERAIMQGHCAEICQALGPRVRLVELGSGSSTKTRLLLENLRQPTYVPVDISREHLLRTAAQLRRAYPQVPIRPLVADFTAPLALPDATGESQKTAVYFPGSTIGNFEPTDARALLRRIRALAGPGGGLLLGADLRKDRRTLEAAYNDAAGVTAQFNLNMLQRLNREFGADFDVGAFRHRAHYDESLGRIEMHLVSQVEQTFSVLGRPFALQRNETLHTENSYKHSMDGLRQLACITGFEVAAGWTDPQRLFAVQWWTVPE
jgi:dimethylhistidine N-methyltransferase